MRSARRWRAVLALLLPFGLLAAEGSAALARTPATALSADCGPARAGALFTVGIEGGFAGFQMRATAYPTGQVEIFRQGGGRTCAQETRTIPLSRAAVRQAVGLANRKHVFAIPKAIQDQTFGADIPVESLTVYTRTGQKSVHAMGGEGNHVSGTAAFFGVWGLFHALAGYPGQVGG